MASTKTILKKHFVIAIKPLIKPIDLIKLHDKENKDAKRRIWSAIENAGRKIFNNAKPLPSSSMILLFIEGDVTPKTLYKLKKFKNFLNETYFLKFKGDFAIGIDCDDVYWTSTSANPMFIDNVFITSRAIDAAAKMVSKYSKHTMMGQRVLTSIPHHKIVKKLEGTIINGVDYKVYSYKLSTIVRWEFDSRRSSLVISSVLNERRTNYGERVDMIFSFIDIVNSSRMLYAYDGLSVADFQANLFEQIASFLPVDYEISYRGDGLMIWTKGISVTKQLENIKLLFDINGIIKGKNKTLNKLKVRSADKLKAFMSNKQNLGIQARISSDFTNGAYKDYKKGYNSQHKVFCELMNDKTSKSEISLSDNFIHNIGLDKAHLEEVIFTSGDYKAYALKMIVFKNDVYNVENIIKKVNGTRIREWDIIPKGKSILFETYNDKDKVKNNGPEARNDNSVAIRDAHKTESTSYNGIHYYYHNGKRNIVIINDGIVDVSDV